jgi:Tol biopolymer transport system component
MFRIKLLIPTLIVAAIVQACASSSVTPAPSQPATIAVAPTIAATPSPFAAPAASPTAASSPTASAVPSLLPHSLYFLNHDSAGLLQVFRLDADGQTLRQVTSESADVNTFDVSPKDGSVAFTSNNQLLLVDSNGAGRRTLLDGGALNGSNFFTNSVGVPLWSPDGQTLAFSYDGLNFYALSSGATTKVLANQIDTSQATPIVGEIYSPNAYSPDGTKLLINIGLNQGGTFGIYDPSTQGLLRFTRSDGRPVCCRVDWAPDGSRLYVSNQLLGMFEPGLFSVDPATGTVSTLLPGAAANNTLNFAYAAQVGPDGKLYFFFNNLAAASDSGHTPLYLVRSDPDGVGNRANLQPNTFDNITEILWAPDASLAIVATLPPNAVKDAGGQVQIVYADGRPSVALPSFGQQMRWGP